MRGGAGHTNPRLTIASDGDARWLRILYQALKNCVN